MTLGIIEFNDAGLRLMAADDPDQCVEMPGLALLEEKNLLLGEAALQQSRLQPLQYYNAFWQRLSAEPLSSHHSRFRHHADLAYTQLLELHKQMPALEQLIFAVPGSFSRDQLSLLLGIAGECPFSAVGLVDSALVSISLENNGLANTDNNRLIHLDMQLHQCVVSLLQIDRGQSPVLQRGQIELLPNTGLLAIWNRWTQFISDQFIEQTRFDPLHSAHTEQQLCNQLPGWIEQARNEEELLLEVEGKAVKLTRQQFIKPLIGHYQSLVKRALHFGGNGQLVLSHRLARLPGFGETASGLQTNTVTLPARALATGITQNLDTIRGDGGQLGYVQSLPIPEQPIPAKPAPTKDGNTAPPQNPEPAPAANNAIITHILVDRVAYPLSDQPLYINGPGAAAPVTSWRAPESRCSLQRLNGHAQQVSVQLVPETAAALQVNGKAVNDNATLSATDRLAIDGISSVQLIEVR